MTFEQKRNEAAMNYANQMQADANVPKNVIAAGAVYFGADWARTETVKELLRCLRSPLRPNPIMSLHNAQAYLAEEIEVLFTGNPGTNINTGNPGEGG